MIEDRLQSHRILFFHSLITCIYFVGIFIYFNFIDKFDNVGCCKLILVLSTLILIEFIKLFFTTYQSNHLIVWKLQFKTFIKIVKDIMKFIITITIITIIYHLIIILYGAPLLSHYEETLMLALTLTILTLIPAILHLGIDNALSLFTNSQFSIQDTFVDAMKLNIKAVLFVTWLSAFVLPLDWDRPWQVWPIPCILGALLGYFTAHFITFIKLSIIKFRKKIKKNNTFKTC